MRKIRILTLILFGVSLILYIWNIGENKKASLAGPEIQMEESEITVSVTDPEEVLLQGVTAVDVKGRDVTDSLVVEAYSGFTKEGKRVMTVAAVDEYNHVSRSKRTIQYSDYVSPKFSLSQPLRFATGTTHYGEAMTVEDCLDGDLTQNIRLSVEEKIQTDTPGDYPVVFSVTNSAGDTVKLPVTVTLYNPVEESVIPHIELSKYIVYIPKGKKFDPWKYVEKVTRGNMSYSLTEEHALIADYSDLGAGEVPSITVKHSVDTKASGVYEAVYQSKVFAGGLERTGSVRLIVVVEE